MTDAGFGYGQEIPNDSGSDFGAVAFVCRQLIAQISTMKLVKVVAVNGGGVNPAGTVDVQPLVSQIDGNGNGTAHGVVHNIPWSRVQGGTNAVICDPQVDDSGYDVAAERDISKVKNTPAAALPGSRRQFDISDGIYAGGCLNVAPQQYLIFTANGVRLVDTNGNSYASGPSGITLTDLSGNVLSTGAGGFSITTTGFFKINGVDMVTHTHGGVTTGAAFTGPPV